MFRMALSVILTVSFSVASQAHEIPSTFFNPKLIVSDLNVIAETLDQENITNGDVILISAVGCGTVRVARRDQVTENLLSLYEKRGYPSSEKIQAIETAAFIDNERRVFGAVGATETTIAYLERSIEQNPGIPESPPAERGRVAGYLTLLEDIACAVREKVPEDPEAQAGEDETAYARTLGLAVLGVGAIAADGFIVTASPNVGTAILSMASGGWGWNRIEESVPTLKELWDSIF